MFYKKILKKIKSQKNIYNFLIKIGKKIPNYPNKYKKNKYLLKNCLTKVWIYLYHKNNKIIFIATSESSIINGIIYLIIKLYSNKYPKQILADKNNVFKKIKFHKLLSINRYIGILNILNYIKRKTLRIIKSN